MRNPIFKTVFRGSRCVERGGGWSTIAQGVRVSFRDGDAPSFTYFYLGFRLFKSVE